jgi:hypothetical protein
VQLFDFEKTNSPTTYRRRALMEFGARCNRCGYSSEVKMLDCHHKDSDRANNYLDNLEILCVWCHALETRNVVPHSWNGEI